MSHTELLFSRPSFIGGFASVLDIGTTLRAYNESPSPHAADVRAIRSDWRSVGNDLRTAMNEHASGNGYDKK